MGMTRIARSRAILPLAVALTALAAGSATPVIAQAGVSAPVVQLNTGRGRLVTLSAPMSDVFVADEKIADVQVRSPTQLYVYGKSTGETTVSATTKTGRVVYAATVRVGDNFDSIGQMLNLALPESRIVATPMNGLVLLTGTALNPEEAAEAERLTQAFVGDKTKVLSRIKNATPLQVNLQVRIAEVSRTFSKNIGTNLRTFDGTGGFKFGVSQGRDGFSPQMTAPPQGLFVGGTESSAGTSLVVQGSNTTTLGLAGRLLGLDILGALDLGERNGQVSTLANPNLTALSGQTSSFLAGGEIPIPVSQGLGAVSVEYKQYGVSLTYTPTVLSDGRISLRVRPEVSQLSSAGAVTIGGTQIPALTTRRAETTVELGSGQSMMIGGLMQNTHNNAIDKTPGAGDLPILGALFRSNAFQRQETELMIVITPYLVRPVDANSIVLPTDAVMAPTDAGRVFLGQLGGGVTGGDRPKPVIAPPVTAVPVLGAQGAPSPLPLPMPADAKASNKAIKPKKASAIAQPGFGPGFGN
ncbi:MAG: type II and III secretion system protein family protein [Pseudomonadota bacterium]